MDIKKKTVAVKPEDVQLANINPQDDAKRILEVKTAVNKRGHALPSNKSSFRNYSPSPQP